MDTPPIFKSGREPGSSSLPTYVREINHYDCGSLMVFAGITLDGHTLLYVFARGYVTAVKANMVDEILESKDIRRMDCPSKSSDLFRLEHAWNTLGRANATYKLPSRTIQGLKTELPKEWD
ncbi:transposable element Tc1 transposase [Trichonephila clavipes]|nr:transposable element Tc1 transposase [Trichonephila clavipes]